MLRADLHTHTLRSDSSNSPEDVIGLARLHNIDIISFTDHDTIPDVAKERELEKQYQITIVSGIECNYSDQMTGQAAHILGYQIEDYSYLSKLCESVLEQRNENTISQIKILQGLGYEVTEQEVRAVTDNPCLYTQNILYVLWKKGLINEIFGDFNKRMFQKGGIAYKTIIYHHPVELVKAIVRGGGKAVLAHPGQQNNFYLIEELVKAGLSGIELIHPSNNKEHRERIQQYAKQYHLFMTGGSDCHGVLSTSGGNIGEYYIETLDITELLGKRMI